MPAGKLYIIVGYITHIPAKGHITKAQSALNNGSKLVGRNIFTPQYAVNIGYGDFHFARGVLFYIS
ncbi:hypothetical protein D3C87_1773820 [compost metagenome]